MRDPRHVRRLTTLFPMFLGLRLVPAGLWFMVLAIPVPGTVPNLLQAVLLALAAAAIWAIHLWYRGRYGLVVAERQRFGRSWALAGGLAAAYLALAGGTGRLEARSLVLVTVLILFAAGAGWALPRLFSGARLAVGIGAVAVIGAAILVALPREPARIGEAGWMFSLALGLVLCAAGWAEHRALAAELSGAAEAAGDA